MKKFTEWVDAVREAELREQSELQKSYQEYFKAKLAKFNVESPADLDDEKKKEFFNDIAKDWEKGKGVKPGAEEKMKEENAEAEEKEAEKPAEDVADLEGDAKDKMKDLTK